MSPRAHLVAALMAEGVTERRYEGRVDFKSLHQGNREIAHFHDDHEIDVRLDAKHIAALGLKHSPESRVHPTRKQGSAWIEFALESIASADDIAALVRRYVLKPQGR